MEKSTQMGKSGRGGRRTNTKLSRPTSSQTRPTRKHLPEDLIKEILYRTPVKSLLRFKCVCKLWRFRISHPKFIQMHLEFSKKWLICNARDRADWTRQLIYYVGVTQLPVPVLEVNTQLTAKVDYSKNVSFFDFSKGMVLAGSVNGIVCVTHSRMEMRLMFAGLWNPSINMWKPVPLLIRRNRLLPSGFDAMENMSIGLGFDEMNGDFRIVRIVPVYLHPDLKSYSWSRVEIYSVNSDSWNDYGKKSFIPFWPKLPNCNFVVDGVPYWVGQNGYPDRQETLCRIDPCSGLYKMIEYPKHSKNQRVHPVKLKESVAVLIQDPDEYANPMADLYLLDKKAFNWTKIHTIGPLPSNVLGIPQCFNTGEIVLERRDGFLLHSPRRVPFFYNPKTGEVHYNNGMAALHPLWYESYSHVESLVAVKGMELFLKRDKKKEKTKPRKKSWRF